MSQLRCYTCLQLDRKLRPLKAQVKFIFALLCPEMFMKAKDTARYLICWECEFIADKIKQFQTRLKKANEALQLSFKGKTTTIEGLSCLTVTAIEVISLPLPQTAQILPENLPMLPENLPKLPENLPMIPENQPIPQFDSNLMAARKLASHCTVPHPSPPLTHEIVPAQRLASCSGPPSSLNQTVPKIVPSIPQNIIEQSLKDMLVKPLKVVTQAEVNIEDETEEHCNKDFDELILSTAILQVPVGESDPLLIPRLNQPAVIEVLPQIPIKDEITDPGINYVPQKLFIDPSKEQIEYQEFRAAVKVEDPNLVMGAEINPVLVNKEIAYREFREAIKVEEPNLVMGAEINPVLVNKEIAYREFREAIKVEDPNLVMGAEINPVLVNKEIAYREFREALKVEEPNLVTGAEINPVLVNKEIAYREFREALKVEDPNLVMDAEINPVFVNKEIAYREFKEALKVEDPNLVMGAQINPVLLNKQTEYRDFRAAVKVEDPNLVVVEDTNLVMGAEINPVLVNKDPVKRKNGDELLTKLLSTPSKCEELFVMRQESSSGRSAIDRQRVLNSNPPKESESSEQSSGVASEQKEAKLILLNRSEVIALRHKKRSNPAYLASSHKCESCIERFHTQGKLDEHNLKHDKSRGNSICDICEQRFADDNLRDNHYKQHFILYECHLCPCRYSNRVQHSNHFRMKHEESTFLCKKCFKVFKTYRERSTHIFETHHQRKGCEECGKRFSHEHKLRRHLSNIHKLNPVECPVCKKMFKKRSLTIHMKTHNDQRDGGYCVECGTSYKTKYLYEFHLKNSLKHNTIEKLGLKCDHCDKYFANKVSLKNHVEEVGGVKYICDICNKESKTKRGLTLHIQCIHEGKKPKKRKTLRLECDVCGKSFRLKKSLEEHLNTHLGIRPHVCSDCGATFTYSAALFTHRRLKHKIKRKYEMTSKMATECEVKE